MGTLKTQIEGTILIAHFQDVSIIDETRIEAVGNELKDLVDKSDQEKIVLSFDEVDFMSSAMIGKLVQFGNMCKEENVALRLCDINSNIKKVFDLMRLDKLFAIDDVIATSMSKMGYNGKYAP